MIKLDTTYILKQNEELEFTAYTFTGMTTWVVIVIYQLFPLPHYNQQNKIGGNRHV